MALPRAGVTGTFLRRVPKADRESGRNWELLCEIVNSLQKRGELVQETRGQWTIRGPLVGEDSPLLEGENKAGVTLVPGHAVAVHSSGTGFVLADATDTTKPVIGFVTTGGIAGVSVTVSTDGRLSLADWSAVTTEASVPLANTVYYLSTTPGKITQTAPGVVGNVVTPVGRPTDPATLDAEIGLTVLL